MMPSMFRTVFSFASASAIAFGVSLAAQQPAPGSARAVAPVDLTGNWVSIVTEDWRFRMVTPPVKDYASVPLNAAARAIADKWDPAKDEAEGNACKSYGAANIMRVPGRLHISWQDDQTLKIEADAGTQTRLFYFTSPQSQGEGWQGASKAAWQTIAAGGRGNAPANQSGSLKVVTTKLKAGYIRRNGVPYSENATLTEYYDLVTEANGDTYLVLTSKLEDPMYLTEPLVTAAHFRKQTDGAGWKPTSCGLMR